MIFDRTQKDVDAAIGLRNEKVKAFEDLTNEEINALERGTITINTLNRIENKQMELANLFSQLSINVNIENKNWEQTQIFNETEFQRILDNLNVLVKSFYVYSNTPNIPKISYNFEDINAIEKILFDLEELYNKALKSFVYCGITYCGMGLNYGVQR
jgi:hypothetical protein